MDREARNVPNVQQVVPFLRVSDIQASVRYYVDGLGFEMTKQWTPEDKLQWCWLERGGAALMLQEIRKEGHGAWMPGGKLGVGVSIVGQTAGAASLSRVAWSRICRLGERRAECAGRGRIPSRQGTLCMYRQVGPRRGIFHHGPVAGTPNDRGAGRDHSRDAGPRPRRPAPHRSRCLDSFAA